MAAPEVPRRIDAVIGHTVAADSEAMSIALGEAVAATLHDDVPVGAVVVRDGLVIASRHNERELRADPTAHPKKPHGTVNHYLAAITLTLTLTLHARHATVSLCVAATDCPLSPPPAHPGILIEALAVPANPVNASLAFSPQPPHRRPPSLSTD